MNHSNTVLGFFQRRISGSGQDFLEWESAVNSVEEEVNFDSRKSESGLSHSGLGEIDGFSLKNQPSKRWRHSVSKMNTLVRFSTNGQHLGFNILESSPTQFKVLVFNETKRAEPPLCGWYAFSPTRKLITSNDTE
jgi:hypothetical protein